jgi:hypothetical protein
MVGQQDGSEAGALDEFPDVGARIDELDGRTGGASHVMRPHQFTDAGGIDARHASQIHDDVPFTTAKQRANLVADALVLQKINKPAAGKNVRNPVICRADHGNCSHHLLDALVRREVGCRRAT